jgi:hypothetical protein
VSLRRAYGTTLRLYTGKLTAAVPPRPSEPAAPAAAAAGPPIAASPPRWIERELPLVSEPATVIALAGLRSLLRAPESKILLLSPLILLMAFGSMFFRPHATFGPSVRAFIGLGAAAMFLLMLLQVITNQFGLDRSGFRALVLSPVRRQDILLGKNLALAPLGLGAGAIALVLFQVLMPMRATDFIASFASLGSLFFLLCMAGNVTSILTPFTLSPGSLKPANATASAIFIQLLFMLLLPVFYGLALLPLFAQLLWADSAGVGRAPIYLIGAPIELALVLFAYRMMLRWQARLLRRHEQAIVAAVAAKG